MAAIIIGALIGSAVQGAFSEKLRTICFQAVALSVIGMGILMAYDGISAMQASKLGGFALVVFAGSLVIGGIGGELLGLDDLLTKFGERIQQATAKKTSKGAESHDEQGAAARFVEGFVAASILFSVGTMAVLGSIQAGLGDGSILLLKSVLDGVSAIVLSSTLGIGVAFSSIPVLLLQGTLALFANFLQPYLGEGVLASINAVGGVLLIAIAFNMLGYKEIRVVNLLPAIFIAGILGGIFG